MASEGGEGQQTRPLSEIELPPYLRPVQAAQKERTGGKPSPRYPSVQEVDSYIRQSGEDATYDSFVSEYLSTDWTKRQFTRRKYEVKHRPWTPAMPSPPADVIEPQRIEVTTTVLPSLAEDAAPAYAEVPPTRQGASSYPVPADVGVKPPPSDDDYEQLFSLLEEADELKGALMPAQATTTFTAPDDGLPIGVAFTGDWHLGAGGVLYKQLKRDLSLIRDTDGLYAVGLGDYRENVKPQMKPGNALYSGLINEPGLQNRLAVMRVLMARGKWLAIADGNHDAWDYSVAGIDNTSKLAQAAGAPFFGEGGGTIFVRLGGVRYALAVRHNGPGNSRLNTTNAQRRTFDEWPEWENVDVVCLAHFHYNDLGQPPRKGESCVYLRSGTYKAAYTPDGVARDGYASRHGFVPEYGVPVVILYPDRRRAVPFRGDNFEAAVRFLVAERAHYRRRTG